MSGLYMDSAEFRLWATLRWPTQMKIRDESAQRSGKRSAPIRVDLDEILLKFTGETGPFWKISARLFIRDLDRTYVGLPT